MLGGVAALKCNVYCSTFEITGSGVCVCLFVPSSLISLACSLHTKRPITCVMESLISLLFSGVTRTPIFHPWVRLLILGVHRTVFLASGAGLGVIWVFVGHPFSKNVKCLCVQEASKASTFSVGTPRTQIFLENGCPVNTQFSYHIGCREVRKRYGILFAGFHRPTASLSACDLVGHFCVPSKQASS